MRTLDWEATAERASHMTNEELIGAIKDCSDAGEASWALQRAGNKVDKTQGYYHDELSVYRREVKERGRREQQEGLL
jgi:hypothetical protein